MKKILILGFLIINSIAGFSQLSITVDSLRQRADTLWFSNRKGSIVYFRTKFDTLYFGDATGEKKVSQIGTGTGGVNFSDTITKIATKYDLTQIESGSSDTIFNTLEYQVLKADTTPSVPSVLKTGYSYWDVTNHTYTDVLENGVKMQRGQEMPKYVINLTGSTIGNGKLVYIVDAGGETPRIALADNRNPFGYKTIGMTTCSMVHGATGYVTTSGKVHDLVTNGHVEGNCEYLGTSGNYTQTKPTTGHVIKIGQCYYAHASAGIIDINIQYLSANGEWNVLNYNGTSGTLIDTNGILISGADDLIITHNDIYNASSSLIIRGNSSTGGGSLTLSDEGTTLSGNNSIVTINASGTDVLTIDTTRGINFAETGTHLSYGVDWEPTTPRVLMTGVEDSANKIVQAEIGSFPDDTVSRSNWDTLVVSGNAYINNPHGAYYRTSDLTITASQNIYYKITGFTNKDTDGLTVAGDSIQLPKGSFLINFTCSFSGNNGEVWEIAISKNGTPENPTQLRYTSNADIGNASCPVYLYSDGNDWISFNIRNTTDGDDPTIKRFSAIITTMHLEL